MIRIKPGDPQPLECKNCCGSHGYQYADSLRVTYYTKHDPDGDIECGHYSDYQPATHYGVTAYCANCGERLKFKINRGEQ